MENREAIASLKTLCNTCTMYPKCVNDKPECFQAIEMAISALEKQEQSCDTCRHGRFGDRQCDNCGVRYPNHYEAEEES